MSRTIKITVFGPLGETLAEQEIKAYEVGKRFSVWCANSQRKLDAMIAGQPRAARATIGETEFTVIDRRSSCIIGVA